VRIEWAVICRYVETLDTGTTMVGVGMDAVEPLVLPADIRLNLAVAIALTYYEMQGTDTALDFRILAPDMTEIVAESVPFRIEGQVKPGFPEGSEGRRITPVSLGFPAETSGTYVLEFRIGRQDPVTLTLFVPPSPE
jgi:hypothetical protein